MDASINTRGLPFVARCLALWWSIDGAMEAERYTMEAVAQAVVRCAAQRSGLKGARQKRTRSPMMTDRFEVDQGAEGPLEMSAALDALLDRSAASW